MSAIDDERAAQHAFNRKRREEISEDRRQAAERHTREANEAERRGALRAELSELTRQIDEVAQTCKLDPVSLVDLILRREAMALLCDHGEGDRESGCGEWENDLSISWCTICGVSHNAWGR